MVRKESSEALLGRYRLEEVVGMGGMGTVARAHDEVLNRTVAIKLLKDELAADAAGVERFRREARIAASLSHPGIAQVYDFGQEHGRSFIVMEFLQGEDLHSLMARQGRLDPPAAAQLVASAAGALHHAHQAGAIHRDIKPGNIFLTRSGEVKVTDFGIARAANEVPLTVTGTIMGTFLYLSPEQALGEPITPASDIYSLGCVAYHLLTGRPPFEADSPAAISMAHVSKPPPSAREANPDVPADLDAAVSKALAKDPRARFSSAAAMASALRAAAGPGKEGVDQILLLKELSQRTAFGSAPATAVTSPAEPTRALKPYAGTRRLRPLAAVVALAVAIVLVILAAGRLGPGASITLPDWKGKKVEQARTEAVALGLRLLEVQEDSPRPAGEVLRQAPPPGTQLEREDPVTVFTSTGRDLVEVPNVIDKKADDAREALEALGFEVREQKVRGPRDEIVVSQNPPGGTLAPRGSTVSLTISEKRGKGDD